MVSIAMPVAGSVAASEMDLERRRRIIKVMQAKLALWKPCHC